MPNLSLAQALRRVKKLKGQIAENESRAKLGVSYDNTKIPAFRYQESVDAMFALQDEMVELESRIAVANATTEITVPGPVSGTVTISMALAIRTLQELKGRIAFLKGLYLRRETVKERTNDWDDTEMKHISRVTETTFTSDLTEPERDTQVRALQDRFEALNNVVEDTNHTVTV